MISVVTHPKGLPDELGDSGGGPDLGSVSVRHGSLQQELDQSLTLALVELRRATGRAPHLQRRRAACVACIAPAHDRDRRAADQPAHLVQRTAFIQQLQGSMTTSLQDLGGATRSHDEYPPGYPS